MGPSVFFPRKNQPIARAPQELICSYDFPENASAAFRCPPSLARFSAFDLVDMNRPRCARSLGTKQQVALGGRRSNERQTFAIGRPNRLTIPVRTWVHISQAFRIQRKNSNK